MNFIFASLIVVLIILLFSVLASIFAAWLDGKDKEKFIDKTVDRVSSLIDSKIDAVTDKYKSGTWYLTVYTKDSNYPIWVSHSTIRSVHPEPWHNKIIIKQFNGEDMVIDNVEYYDMCAANDLCDYEM